jgi:hypothetical protein
MTMQKGARGGGVNEFFPSSLPLKIKKKIKKTVCGFFFYFFKLKFNSIILIYRRKRNGFQSNTLLLYVLQLRSLFQQIMDSIEKAVVVFL